METKVVKGRECVVIHVANDHEAIFDNGSFRAACTGEIAWMPPENEKRPYTLCENCRLKVVRGG